MNTLKLQHLLSRKYSTSDMDRLSFLKRIRAEHVFVSFEECIEYLTIIVTNLLSINPDNILPVPLDINPILVINIVDEAVCSMVYEIYKLRYKEDKSTIGYYRRLVADYYNMLNNKVSKMSKEDLQKYRFCIPLLTIMERIGFLCTPGEEKEESNPKNLAKSYYDLMHTLYKYATPYDDYNRKLENFYYKLLSREILE